MTARAGLVLTARERDEVVIRVPGRRDPIIVSVVLLRNDRVRLGFFADREIEVNRRKVDIAKQNGVPK